MTDNPTRRSATVGAARGRRDRHPRHPRHPRHRRGAAAIFGADRPDGITPRRHPATPELLARPDRHLVSPAATVLPGLHRQSTGVMR